MEDLNKSFERTYGCTIGQLQDLERRFVQAGGETLLISPSCDNVPLLARIPFTDSCYYIPVCHQGFNRSQILYVVLVDLCKRLGIDHTEYVSKPHGALGGCDPHTAYTNLSPYDFYEYLYGDGTHLSMSPEEDTDIQTKPLHTAFRDAFGRQKVPRVGDEIASAFDNLNNESNIEAMERERTHLNKYFTKEFYGKHDPQGRTRVFICFQRAVPVVMRRLLESFESSSSSDNDDPPESAEDHHPNINAVIFGIPWGDNVNAALCYRESADKLKQAHLDEYRKMYSLFHV